MPNSTLAHLPIDQETQELLFTAATTARGFTDEPVTDEQIHAIYELIKWGPVAFNAQPLRIVIVRSDEAKAKMMKHVFDGNKAKTEQAPVTVILAADTNFHNDMHRTIPSFPAAQKMFDDADNREAFARHQAWLQAGYFIIGVRAAGLAAGPMTGYNAHGVDEDLLAGTGLKSIALVNIGHADPSAAMPRAYRFTKEEAVRTI